MLEMFRITEPVDSHSVYLLSTAHKTRIHLEIFCYQHNNLPHSTFHIGIPYEEIRRYPTLYKSRDSNHSSYLTPSLTTRSNTYWYLHISQVDTYFLGTGILKLTFWDKRSCVWRDVQFYRANGQLGLPKSFSKGPVILVEVVGSGYTTSQTQIFMLMSKFGVSCMLTNDKLNKLVIC